MTTEQRIKVRRALIEEGFRRPYVTGDEFKTTAVAAIFEQNPHQTTQGRYTELFRHPEGTVVSISWAPKTEHET